MTIRVRYKIIFSLHSCICLQSYHPQVMKLYHENSSIFSQSCLLLVKHLNLQIEVEDHEPHDEQFVSEINPILRVPVFIDDELVLTESRAIMTYLIENLQPGSSLYSKDLKKRALIDQRLFYDAAVVVPILMELIVSEFEVFGFKFNLLF